MIEQLYTEEKKIRITGGENGKTPEFLEINKYNPETDEIIGDITEARPISSFPSRITPRRSARPCSSR